MRPVWVVLLVIGPFAALMAWWLIEMRAEKQFRAVAEPDHRRFARLNRVSMAAGWLFVVGYCIAIFTGLLKTRSGLEGIVLLVGALGWVLFSTRRTVRESVGSEEAPQLREARFTLVMLIVFGAILGVAGWLSATHSIR